MVVGGQAVIEGVMMRAPGRVATAVRRSDGTIAVRGETYSTLAERYRVFRLPVLRGGVGLIEMLIIGFRSLNYSAEAAMGSDPTEGSGNGTHAPGRPPGENVRVALALALALVVAVAVLFVTPLVTTTLWFRVDRAPLTFNLIAGGIRLGLFLLYLFSISLMKDVRRLFEYHGAEHKVVFAFEREEGLSLDAAAGQSRFHPRCGTGFLLVVMLAAILLFALLDTLVLHALGGISLSIRIATHLPLVPLLGGVSYELIRISASNSETFIGRLIVAPGLWFQKVTTREPDEGELEVALAALRSALGEAAEASRTIACQAAG
jgi:uncharacterized protein YqhQ